MASTKWICFVVVLLATCSPNSQGQTKLAPEWSGGYSLDGNWTLLRMHVSDRESGVSATIDLPSLGLAAQPVTDLRQESSAITFVLFLSGEQLAFAGRVDEDAIQGTVAAGERKGRFQLLRSAAPDRNSLAQYEGAYEWSPGQFVYVEFWGELGKDQLGTFDESGKVRALYPMGNDKFFAGPGVAFPVPLEARVTFHRDAQGAVTSMSWESSGEVPRIARRAKPYSQTEVAFRNGNVHLAGTLTLPNSAGKHPALILVHGSGPEDRDALLPFTLPLVRHGIALLAYDKRGVGGSTGDWTNSSFGDLAGDATAALAFLESRADIDAAHIGIFGVSQGGWVGPLVASRSKDIAFVISVSGAGVPPAEETLDYMQNELRINKVPQSEIAEAVSLITLAYDYARTGTAWDQYSSARQKLANRAWLPYIGAPDTREDPQWAFMRLTYFYDPMPALEKVHCPTLALFGGLDLNVLPQKNKSKWESALKHAGNPDYTLLILPKGNHVLMEARDGSVEEFPGLQRFLPEYLTTLLTWMSQRIPGFEVG